MAHPRIVTYASYPPPPEAKTFEMLPDNTSDHVPVQLYLNYSWS